METSTEKLILGCKDASIGYDGPPVLKQLNLEWKQGSGPLAFSGPNGTGKSTLMKACLGLLKPESGTLHVLGADPSKKTFRSNLWEIGYIPQQRPPGVLRVSVRELVALSRAARLKAFQSFSHEDHEAVDQAMELCGVMDLADVPVQELSGGQFQRSSIARAMAMKPKLFFLDEPTTFLDKDSRKSVVQLLQKLISENHTELVLISHDHALLELCTVFWAFGSGSAEPCNREQVLAS